MGQTTVTWIRNFEFVATDSTNHSVILSSTDDNVGMKPSELLLSALGSCAGYDVVSILGKRKKDLRNLRVDVTAEQANEGWPRPYTAFHMHFVVDADVTPEEVERAITLSEEKYCSVAATLRPAEITWDYEIVAQAATTAGD